MFCCPYLWNDSHLHFAFGVDFNPMIEHHNPTDFVEPGKYWFGQPIDRGHFSYVRFYFHDRKRATELFEWLRMSDLTLENKLIPRVYLSVVTRNGEEQKQFSVFYMKRYFTTKEQILFKLTFGG